MELQLTAMERFAMLSILPAEGNYLTLVAIRVLREELAFDEEAQKEYGISVTEEGTVNILELEETATFDVPDTIYAMVKDKLKNLERTSKLTADHISLFEKLILEK